MLKERLGFEARIFRPKEPYWSLFLENGTVLGLVFKQCVRLEIFIFHIFSSLQVGLLHRNEIDISPVSGGRLQHTALHSTTKQFLAMKNISNMLIFQGYFALSGLRASRFPMDLLAFAQVFTKRSWLVLSLLGVFACGAIALAAKMSKREKMHRRVTFKNWISIMF